MSDDRPIWGLHQEWDDEPSSLKPDEIAVGWDAVGDLSKLASTRDAYKAAFAAAYPSIKQGAVPAHAGVLFRFATQMRIGDIVVYPSKADRLVNLGRIVGDYTFRSEKNPRYPHRRKIEWVVQTLRAKFSQAALYEIGSAATLFQVTSNAEEFAAAIEGREVS